MVNIVGTDLERESYTTAHNLNTLIPKLSNSLIDSLSKSYHVITIYSASAVYGKWLVMIRNYSKKTKILIKLSTVFIISL